MHASQLRFPGGEALPRRTLAGPQISFRRAMVVLTLIFWGGIYVLFTVRALGIQRPLLAEQALCRLAMMPVGLSTCAVLYLIATWTDRLKTWQAILLLVAAISLASGFYSAMNFFTFYVAVDYWESRYSPAVKIGLDAQDFVWIFSTWMALFYLVRFGLRTGPSAGGEIRPGYASEIWVKHGESRLRVDLRDVSWFAAEGDYVRIHIDGSSYLLRSTTSQMERKLDPAEFIRIHRGAIISFSRLRRICRRADGRVTVIMANGAELPVGRAFRHRLQGLVCPQPVAGAACDEDRATPRTGSSTWRNGGS